MENGKPIGIKGKKKWPNMQIKCRHGNKDAYFHTKNIALPIKIRYGK